MYNPRYPSKESYINALKLIESSVEGEKADAMFYEWLISNIPQNLKMNEKESIKQTIIGIRDDELGHNQQFKKIYKQLTNREVGVVEEDFVPPNSFEEGIVKALNGELSAVKKYREIMEGMPSNYYRDQLFNILTDELRHANFYNYIYTTIRSN